ncbi:odorant receptor 9a-like isoform X3 [Temnothorax longispinosus]|uniref:odorant receptor 9a-like isoform X3 n=1 Tax=Temnothorax longispinosus TaxID=300112 RepID=UPI003A9A252D
MCRFGFCGINTLAQQEIRDRMGDIEQFFRDSHYNIIRILLSISGLWPFHTQYRRYAIYLAMLLILGSGFIFEMLGVIEIKHDSFEVIDALPLLCFAIVTISKTFCAVYTLPQMQEYCLSPKSDEETKIQISHAQYGQKLGYTYTGLILGHSIIYILSTLLTRFFHTESKEINETSSKVQIGLPHRVNYMVDLDTYYVPIFIHSAICDFSYTVLLVIFDVLYLTLVEYCCGLFAALRYRLETALVFENDRLTMTTTKNISYANIAYSIRRHTETMQFVAIIESIYSIPLCIHIGLTVLILSVQGYQVINNTEDINRLLKLSAYLNGVLINVFFQNWQGQKIIDSSEKVFESAYNSEWYSMPIAARKLLIMIMMRCEKPSILKMGEIVVLSYVTFNTVLRTSSSYFMLLRSL